MAALKLVYSGATVVDPDDGHPEVQQAADGDVHHACRPRLGDHRREVRASVGADAPRKPMGSGPFSFVNWVQGVQIELAQESRMDLGKPDVMGTSGPAKLDSLTFKYLNDPQTRTAAVEAGDVHFIDLVPFQNLGSLTHDDKHDPGHPAARSPTGQLDEHPDPAVR